MNHAMRKTYLIWPHDVKDMSCFQLADNRPSLPVARRGLQKPTAAQTEHMMQECKSLGCSAHIQNRVSDFLQPLLIVCRSVVLQKGKANVGRNMQLPLAFCGATATLKASPRTFPEADKIIGVRPKFSTQYVSGCLPARTIFVR